MQHVSTVSIAAFVIAALLGTTFLEAVFVVFASNIVVLAVYWYMSAYEEAVEMEAIKRTP